ncbi:VOC family protein [Chitinophaga filiformis]|uniref:VOC family protein n=1 Tax=Chitinophaga filiformis TaxID=104663 RepID=A0ABY4HU73_CHIFI|nr:VOC family protein [Chitinophaga filiformis]UPK67339.1 VOC family protein [Chitinophaga filiformis]
MKQNGFLKAAGFVLLMMLFAGSAQSQNKVSLLGVDHFGINVPDLQQAVNFFTDVLDFKVVTQIGPVPLDSNWKEANHMNQATGPVTIKMTRAGDGANIELFYYDKNKGSTTQPGGDDIGATHIAFYTADIKASIAYLKSKGVTFLGEPFTMPVGDTEGETWVYFLTPWGSKMELVTYPNGKGYEKHNPGVKLWSPKNVPVKLSAADTLSKGQLQQLATRHLEIWNNTAAAARLAGLASLYTANVLFVDASYVSTGQEGLNTFIGNLQQSHPGFRFSLARIEANHNMVRLFWNYGDKAHPSLVKGVDIITVEQGKIKSLYAFLDTVSK